MASINHLAEEMISKILSWLPVLSLLRCKSVCKSWKSIISDPHFIQAHLTTSLNKPPFSLLRVASKGALQDFFIDTQGENSIKVTLPDYMSGMHFYIRSCNGLVTLADIHAGVLYIWNPLTRLFKLLPQSKIYPNYSNLVFANNLGFGFDSVSNDYKILRVVLGGYSCSDGNVTVMVAELYSVNADSWKEIRVPKEMHGFKHHSFPKCVCLDSGVLYFEGCNEILSFDLHDEVFGLYQYPHSGYEMSGILDFDGSIVVIMTSGGDGSVLSLWKLDGVGDNVSWAKMFNIEPDLKIDFIVLYLGDKHFLAVDYEVGFFFYNYRKKRNNIPLARVSSEYYYIYMPNVQFIGSLISLEGFERRE